MAKNRAEWASGHRQLTRIGLSQTAAEGNSFQWRCNQGIIAINLRAIWEMSAKLLPARDTLFPLYGSNQSPFCVPVVSSTGAASFGAALHFPSLTIKGQRGDHVLAPGFIGH